MTSHHHADGRYASTAEVEALVRGFESGALPPSSFDHRAHLTVAAWYLLRLPAGEAEARMRTGIQKFLGGHQLDLRAYNETITLFWMRTIRNALRRRAEKDRRIEEMINWVLETYNDPHFIYKFYTRARIASEEARAAWAEPDVSPLDP